MKISKEEPSSIRSKNCRCDAHPSGTVCASEYASKNEGVLFKKKHTIFHWSFGWICQEVPEIQVSDFLFFQLGCFVYHSSFVCACV